MRGAPEKALFIDASLRFTPSMSSSFHVSCSYEHLDWTDLLRVNLVEKCVALLKRIYSLT